MVFDIERCHSLFGEVNFGEFGQELKDVLVVSRMLLKVTQGSVQPSCIFVIVITGRSKDRFHRDARFVKFWEAIKITDCDHIGVDF